MRQTEGDRGYVRELIGVRSAIKKKSHYLRVPTPGRGHQGRLAVRVVDRVDTSRKCMGQLLSPQDQQVPQ